VAAGLVAVALVTVAVTVATQAWFSTRTASERTTASLTATRAEIRRTEDDLADAADEHRTAQATLGDQVAALADRRDEHAAAQADLDVVTLMLAQVQAQLTASQVDLVESAVRLDAFGRCLVGVAQALNQAAVSDTDGLARTIRGIEGDCARAGVAL
jgi:septal ring factor EnvC (AmiA/AmiB activator)